MRSLWGSARRKKDSRDWYVGSTVCEARRTTLALDFLDAGRTYEATVYRDADTTSLETNPDAYVVERKNVRKGDSLTLDAVREREHCFMMSASPENGTIPCRPPQREAFGGTKHEKKTRKGLAQCRRSKEHP